MSLEGWYYLHVNGDMIYKKELGGTAADIRDSDFARGLWPFDPSDREGCWRILVESLAGGASPIRIKDLAEKWQADNDDAKIYAERLPIRLYMDGDQWCATRVDFVNLQESESGFGGTALEAMAALATDLDYTPTKMWGATFKDLVKP